MVINRKHILSLILIAAGCVAVFVVVRADPGSVHLPALLKGAAPSPTQPAGNLGISSITDNRADYPNGQVPANEKLEITFQVTGSVFTNPYMPYDPNLPAGMDPASPAYRGVTVNASFSPDNWQTTYQQPAFYYQDFSSEVHNNREWFYPTGGFSWKARFAPNQAGTWQYRLSVQDASGSVQSSVQTISVSAAANPGFVRVSSEDRRYFETSDGEYFSGLGYNLNFNAVSWVNPVLDNEANFQKLSQNGIRLVRMWLSQWGIYTSGWNPWNSIVPDQYGQYIPFSGLTSAEAYAPAGSETSMIVNSVSNPCMFIGWLKSPPAVKTNTNYRIRIRYITQNIEGPRIPGAYGLVAKLGGWLYDDAQGPTCDDLGNGTVVSAYQSQNTYNQAQPWNVLEGSWNSGNNYFLPNFYITIENVTRGRAFIDYVWIEEVKPGGQYGANIVSKPWMSHHLYFEQRNSYAFDQVVELAHQYGVYLRPVLLEKNEWIFNRIMPDGSFATGEPANNDNFYGEHRNMTKGRWLQRAWWRYLQARWGYSANIHSWELLNEGDPGSTRHFALADELGKYMNCGVFGLPVGAGGGAECVSNHPNRHMVSTSFWHSFPAEAFWANASYPNLDFADVHAYNSTGWLDDPLHEIDSAAYHIEYSANVRNTLQAAAGGAGMPIIRGEAGLDTLSNQVEQPDLALDTNGVWLHNYVWASLHPGGLIEQYWWTQNLETKPGPDGAAGLHDIYGDFASFLDGIPLNNGQYENANAGLTSPNLRVVGQKDAQANRAHLWVQNKNHTWRNVVDGIPQISGLAGSVSLDGFSANTSVQVTWYEFVTTGQFTTRMENVNTTAGGVLVLNLPTGANITDVGIKIGVYP